MPCEPDAGAPSSRRSWHERRRLVRVPASSANLGPGFDVLGAALGPAHGGRGGRRPGSFAVHTDLAIARDRRNLVVRGFARAAPAGRLRVHDPLGHPAVGRAGDERGGDRRRPGGGRLDLRARRRPAGARRPSSRATRTTSRRRCWAGSCCAATGARERFEPPAGLEGLLVVREQGGAHRRRRARRCRRGSRSPTRCSTSRTPALLVLGLDRGDLDLVARGLADRIHQPRRAHLYPRSWELVQQRARARRAGRDDLRRRADRAGLVRRRVDRRGRRARCRPAAAGWAEVLRVPFAPAGADVREL